MSNTCRTPTRVSINKGSRNDSGSMRIRGASQIVRPLKANNPNQTSLETELEGLGMFVPKSHDHAENTVKVLHDRQFKSFCDRYKFPDTCFWKPGNPHIVYICVWVQHFGDLKILDGTFQAEVFFRIYWKPSREEVNRILQTRAATVDSNLIEFRPNISCSNNVEINKVRDWSNPELDFNLGRRCFHLTSFQLIKVIAREDYKLKNFPVDCQDLSLKFTPGYGRDYTSDKIRWEPASNFGNYAYVTPCNSHDFAYKNAIIEFLRTDPSDNASGMQWCNIEVRIKIQRKWQHYFYRLCLVMSLVAMTVCVGFTIDLDEDFSDACAYMSTCLLTIVAFMFVVTSSLPTIPYLTLLDYFVYTLLVYVAFMMISLMMTRFNDNWDSIILFYISVALWIAIHIFFAILMTVKHKEEKRKLTMNGYELTQYYGETKKDSITFPYDPKNLPHANHYLGGSACKPRRDSGIFSGPLLANNQHSLFFE